MPTRPKGRCTYQGCTAKAVKDGRCAQHQRPAWIRPSAHTRQLDPAAWRKARQAALDRDRHRCVRCGRLATEVDHVWEIADGGSLYDLANLQSLCHDCHAAKTLAARRRRGHKGQGPSLAVRIFDQLDR